jgi:hypothetical protein
VRFNRTVAKGQLKIEALVWSEKEFEARFTKLQRLESKLKQIVDELEPKRIKWPPSTNVAPLPAHFAPTFFSPLVDVTNQASGPLPLQVEARESRSRDKPGS